MGLGSITWGVMGMGRVVGCWGGGGGVREHNKAGLCVVGRVLSLQILRLRKILYTVCSTKAPIREVKG